MKWSEMSKIQRWLFVISWICGVASLVLGILGVCNVLENTNAISHALWGMWCLGHGATQTSAKMRILWYVLAVLSFLLCLLWVL